MANGISYKIGLFGIPVLILVLAMLVATSEKPVDWSLGYSKKETKPFGGRLLFDLLPVLTGGKAILTNYGSLASLRIEDEPRSYLYLNDKIFWGEEDLEHLNAVLDKGHNVFVASNWMSEEFLDTMGIKTNRSAAQVFQFKDSVNLNLVNRSLKSGLGYWYRKNVRQQYFVSYDTLRTTVLGIDNAGHTNFIRVKKGKGWLYVHLNPIVFTNYHLLDKDKYLYAFKCLSYLPDNPIVWDEHYKYNRAQEISTFGYVFQHRPLKTAFFLLGLGVILFMVFNAFRRQRAIPVLSSPENTTVSFVETIGRLYYNTKNHHDIASKKYIYFKEFVRSRYYLDTARPNAELYQQLSVKSGVPLRSIRQLFEMGDQLKRTSRLSEADLEEFNRKVEYFYEQCQ